MNTQPPQIQQTPPPLPQRLRSGTRDNASLSIIVVVAVVLLVVVLLAASAAHRSKSVPATGGIAEPIEKLEGAEDQDAPTNFDKSAAESTHEDGQPPLGTGATTNEDTPSEGMGDTAESDLRGDAESRRANVEAPSETIPRTSGTFIPFPSYDGTLGVEASPRLGVGKNNPFLQACQAMSVVFVIDKSSSMSLDRMDRVLATLLEAIESLDDNQEFLVLFFDDSMRSNPDFTNLVAATEENKGRVRTWISSIEASGGTSPLQAMLHAISQAPEKIVILSDGEFEVGDANQIMQANQRSGRHTKIDAVGLSEVVEVLQDLASSNGGVYYQAR